MANPSAPESAPKVVTIQRFQISVNVLIQAIVFFAIVVMLNYMSFRHFKRWDYSRDKKYELSTQTKNLLKNLKKPVRAVIFFSGGTEIAPDVGALLREYEFAANKKFRTEVVDPYRNFSRAQELQTKYRFNANENIVILDIEGKSKFVNATDMADFETPDQMSMMMGQTQPRLKAFKGEQAITSALLELLEEKPNKVYFITGHGEPELGSADLKAFNDGLKRQNIQIAPLNLLNVNAIPEDARALIVYGPKRDVSDLEQKLLSDYWAKNGRIFLLLNPYAQTPLLSGLAISVGIVPQEDRVLRTGTMLQYDEQGKPQLVNGVVAHPTFVVADSHTKITRDLVGLSKRLIGATQSLRIDQEQQKLVKAKIHPLLQSGEGFWGETDIGGIEKQVFFDPQKDNMGPLTLAAALEKGGVEDERVKVETSRLVVVGNAEMLGFPALRESEGITGDLTISILNWLLDREELIGIPPKEKSKITVSLTEQQVRSIAMGTMVLLPGLVAIFGLLNWSLRRS